MSIKDRINALNARIRTLEEEYHRSPSSVQLLAVTKSRTITEIVDAFEAGISHFGENYYQEALSKINALHAYPLCWHFIGPIQRNKVKGIAQHFSWVHSLSRLDIAEKLNQARSKASTPLNVCIQVNIDKEETKQGIDENDIAHFAKHLSNLPMLALRGLMVIPQPEKTKEECYQTFLHTSQLLAQLNQTLNLSLDTLSMGMSDDLAEAIRAGSTWIRIGRGIFGERAKKSPSSSQPDNNKA